MDNHLDPFQIWIDIHPYQNDGILSQDFCLEASDMEPVQIAAYLWILNEKSTWMMLLHIFPQYIGLTTSNTVALKTMNSSLSTRNLSLYSWEVRYKGG